MNPYHSSIQHTASWISHFLIMPTSPPVSFKSLVLRGNGRTEVCLARILCHGMLLFPAYIAFLTSVYVLFCSGIVTFETAYQTQIYTFLCYPSTTQFLTSLRASCMCWESFNCKYNDPEQNDKHNQYWMYCQGTEKSWNTNGFRPVWLRCSYSVI